MTSFTYFMGGTSPSGCKFHRRRAAFTLVEVVLALGICSFCLLSILAMTQMGVTRAHDSLEESRATDLLSAIALERRTVPTTNACSIYPLPNLSTVDALQTGYFGIDDNGKSTGTSLTTARYRVDYQITPPTAPSEAPYLMSLVVSWPALAAQRKDSVEMLATFPQP
jgi:type II secretory pathway pseudopilin PulG